MLSPIQVRNIMRKLLFPIIVGLLLIGGLVGLFSAKWHGELPAHRPVIIDTDMSSDDWMAILYLLKHPDIDIRGIIIDGNGSAHLKAAITNLQKLLALVGYDKTLIIGEGRKYNLLGNKQFPENLRQLSDKLPDMPIKAQAIPQPDIMSARSAYYKLLHNTKQPVTILAIGPLTALANALRQNPKLKQHIHRIVMLGGAIKVSGNIAEFMPESKNTTAEWNFYIDPLAAQIVLQSGIPITLIPLDATNQVPLDETLLKRFKKYPTTPSIAFVTKLLKNDYFNNPNANFYFWDPLAASVLVHPEFVNTQPMALSVETKATRTWGQVHQHPNGNTIDVALSVSAEAFISDFVSMLAKNTKNTDG